MPRYYVIAPEKGEHWGPYTRLLQAQDFARIGSQHGTPREVRRGKVGGKLVRKYKDGERAWPTMARQLQQLKPGEVPRVLRKNPMKKRPMRGQADRHGVRWRVAPHRLGYYRVEEDEEDEILEDAEYPRFTVWVKKELNGKLVGSGTIERTSLESSKYPRRPPHFELRYGYEASDDATSEREEFSSQPAAVDWLVRGLLSGWDEAFELNPMRENGQIASILDDEFLSQYFETALWSSRDEGDPMDKNYGLEDFDYDTLVEMATEAEKWRYSQKVSDALKDLEGFTEGDVGHDFWLTRNGHGAGFWDGDWPEPEASILDRAATSVGEMQLYIGDDGLIYSFKG
jgi:hypothetical protein